MPYPGAAIGKRDEMPGKQDQTTAAIRGLPSSLAEMIDSRLLKLERLPETKARLPN